MKEIDNLIKRLELDFSSFAKELKAFRYVIDLTPLGPKQKQEIERRFPSPYYKSPHFIVLKSKREFEEVGNIISKRRQQTKVSQKRKDNLILELSRAAQFKFASAITKKTQNYKKYTSPEVRAEINDKIRKRLNKFKLAYVVDSKDPQHLKEKLVRATIANIASEIKRNQDYLGVAKTRADDIVYTAKTGKIRNTSRRKKVTKKSSKKVSTEDKKFYALQNKIDNLAITVDFRTMLNAMLHDKIKEDHMESSGAAPSPSYLRYQTGRFARSARVITVMDRPRAEGVNIWYTYMEDPYETFKGKGHGRGRNPEFIISSAIREIMQDHVTTMIIRKA